MGRGHRREPLPDLAAICWSAIDRFRYSLSMSLSVCLSVCLSVSVSLASIYPFLSPTHVRRIVLQQQTGSGTRAKTCFAHTSAHKRIQTVSALLTLAPFSSSSSTTFRWPFRAAIVRPVFSSCRQVRFLVHPAPRHPCPGSPSHHRVPPAKKKKGCTRTREMAD